MDINKFRDLYPFESNWMEIGGLRYHYIDEGSGAPVLMVHGNPTWSIYYRNVVRTLRGSHRVVVPDHIGMGLSEKPGDDRYGYRLDDRIADLDALIQHLDLREITLVVHDWGGVIGLGWAARNPERVARLVILNTAAFPLPTDRRLPWQLGLVRFSKLGGWTVRALNSFALIASYVAVRNGMDPHLRHAYLAPYDSWKNRIAVLRFVEDIPLAPSDPSYATLAETGEKLDGLRDKPTMLCWGTRDFVFDEGYLRIFEERFPAAEVHRFAEAGHYVLEDASDEIIARIESFLERHPLQNQKP